MKPEKQKPSIIDRTSKTTDAWAALRGALKDVFSELGGGESYLRSERKHFYTAKNVDRKRVRRSSTSK